MSSADVEIVAEVVRRANDGDYGGVAELLSDSFFARLANGRAYAGPAGLAEMIHDETARNRSRHVAEPELRDLGRGFVLLSATIERERLDGTPESVVGAWLFHVRGGRAVAVVYFPDAEQAVAALPPHARAPSAVEVLERVLAAFNRRDLVELVGLLDESFVYEPGPGAEPIHGAAEVLVRVLDADAAGDDAASEYEITGAADGFAIAQGTVFRRRGDEVAREPRVGFARVVDGLVTEWRLTPDRAAAEAEIAARTGSGPDLTG